MNSLLCSGTQTRAAARRRIPSEDAWITGSMVAGVHGGRQAPSISLCPIPAPPHTNSDSAAAYCLRGVTLLAPALERIQAAAEAFLPASSLTPTSPIVASAAVGAFRR